MKKMTNKQPKCECGSGYMPTIMDSERARWACCKCYRLTTEQARGGNMVKVEVVR